MYDDSISRRLYWPQEGSNLPMPHQEATPEEINRILKQDIEANKNTEPAKNGVTKEEGERIIKDGDKQ